CACCDVRRAPVRIRETIALRVIVAFLFVAAFRTTVCVAQSPGGFDGCPLEGKTTRTAVMALNRLKHRTVAPLKTDVNPTITLTSVLAPGNDIGRWNESQAAIITGFVVAVKPGGPETVNCGATDPAHTDTHIELALSADDSQGIHHMIVEVTPRWRAIMSAKGKDWSTANLRSSLKGRKITVV